MSATQNSKIFNELSALINLKSIGMDTNWPTISNSKTFCMSTTQKLQTLYTAI